jgi:transaldolase
MMTYLIKRRYYKKDFVNVRQDNQLRNLVYANLQLLVHQISTVMDITTAYNAQQTAKLVKILQEIVKYVIQHILLM